MAKITAKKVVKKSAAGQVTPKAPEVQFVEFGRAFNNFFQKYFDYRGTATRAEYWWMALLCWGLYIIPGINLVWAMATFIPFIMLTIRRIHDIGKSGWTYYGVVLLSYAIPPFFVMMSDGYGITPSAVWACAMLFLATVVLRIVWLATPSKVSGNRYR